MIMTSNLLPIQSTPRLEPYFLSSVMEIKSLFLFIFSVILLRALFLENFPPHNVHGHSQFAPKDSVTCHQRVLPQTARPWELPIISFSQRQHHQFLFLNLSPKTDFCRSCPTVHTFSCQLLEIANSDYLCIQWQNQPDLLCNPEQGTNCILQELF